MNEKTTENTIEEKDKRLVRKIRTIVAQKERRPLAKQPVWKKPSALLALVCLVLVVIGLTVFKKEPATAVPDVASTSPAPEARKDKPPTENQQLETASKTEPDAVAEIEAPAEKKDLPEEAPSASEHASVPPEASAQASLETHESTATENTPPQTVAEEPASAVQSPSAIPDIQITHLTVCAGVRKKQSVREKSTFSLTGDGKVYVWMRVLSKTPPLTLTHVYTVNGNHYCDVPLTIPYPHMRTWSKVSLDHQWQVGDWHVDVVDGKGTILGQADFTVVP